MMTVGMTRFRAKVSCLSCTKSSVQWDHELMRQLGSVTQMCQARSRLVARRLDLRAVTSTQNSSEPLWQSWNTSRMRRSKAPSRVTTPEASSPMWFQSLTHGHLSQR
eukprot:Blabericola_migrator_1__11604@NODE_6973_length_438_cov_2_355795_g4899_i0_p2_GENE_NODE_6973_length_438_cov_2_355795_g4899_i0NODE_6973_length_438_cov_2_355795_g4899_i0_p2_ORF_typecomplete_len107_score2_12ADD_DNMT3/PF17980_1/0_11_NODE_6973_length_438_cov_2_355795_g4899_i03323